MPTPPATVNAPVYEFVVPVAAVTANPDTDKISVEELNENVLSLETAEPEVDDTGVNNTGCAKLEFPAPAILRFEAVVADPEVIAYPDS